VSEAPPGAGPDDRAAAATGSSTDADARQAPSSMLSVITRLGVGGSDQRLYDVLEALDDTEHHVVVGADSTDEAIGRIRERHRVTVEPTLVRQVDPRRDAAVVVRLVQELRRGGHAAVMTHQSKAGLVGRVAALVARTPHVYHSASMASFGPGYGRAQSLVFQAAERATQPLVDRYFVVGRDLADRMIANGTPPGKLEIVRSGIDTAPFVAARDAGRAAARAELDLPADDGVVCFVGRLDERKGAPRLADLFASIAERSGGPVTFLVAGRGPCAEALERRVADLGLAGAVRLLGHTDRVPQVLAASDVVLLPSSAEGLPQVLVQAAVTGTPFASFDVDGAREVLALGAVGTVAPIGADDVLVAHAASLLDRRRGGVAGWRDDVLAQWDRAEILRAYRDALAGGRASLPHQTRGRTS
jgi:glycosyltransferase involved in cell wall biosynthesis